MMNPTFTSGPAAEAKQLLLRVVSRAVVGAAVAVVTFGVSPASASLTGEVVGAAGSVVKSVTPPAPSLPEPLPPPPPPPAPSPPAPDPVPTVAGGAKKVVDSVVDVVARGDAGGASKKAITEVSGASKEARKPVAPLAPSARDGGSVDTQLGGDARAPTARAGAAGNDARAPGNDAAVPGGAARKLAAREAPPSIRSAREAPVRRWLARVWPAIALAADGPASARSGDGLALTVADVTRLLLGGTPRADAGGVAGAESASANASRTGPVGIPMPGGREITFFVIFSFVALLALLLSTVWVEVRSKYLYR